MGRVLLLKVVIMTVACSAIVGAQERTITESDFLAYKNKAFKALGNTPYREKRTINTKEVNQLDWVPFTIDEFEYIRPDRMYWRHTTLALGEPKPTTERINIGDRKFVRYNGKNWQEEAKSAIKQQIAASEKDPKPTVEYKYLGSTILMGQRVTLIQKTLSEKQIRNGRELFVIHVEKNWFDDAGRFLQQEFLTNKPPERSLLQIIVYKYDPNIKIEPPIL